jgi:hypothetical protein
VRYSKASEKGISVVQIVEMLLSEGWTFNDGDGSSYLPLCEIEGFHWVIQKKISPEFLMNMLREKESLNECIGVVMTWQDTDVGGSFMFRRSQQFSVLLNVNRKVICDENYTSITDASWYLSHLIPIFDKHGIHIEYFAFEQLA